MHNVLLLPKNIYAGVWPEESCELEPVLLSVLVSGSFLGIGSLVFSETLYGIRGPYGDVLNRARFFLEKSPFGKNDQKWRKNGVLGLFRKIYSLVLSGNGVDRMYL